MKKRRKINIIIFVVIEIFLLFNIVSFFITPLIRGNYSFEDIYKAEEKIMVDKILESIKNETIPSLSSEFVTIENLDEGLEQLNYYFKENQLRDSKLINCSFKTIKMKSVTARTTSFQYSVVFNNNKYALLTFEIYTENNDVRIKTFRVNPLTESIEDTNSFYGEKIDANRIVLLILSAVLIIMIAYTEYDYYKNIQKQRIWLQLLIPISICKLTINWNTLDLDFNLLNINTNVVTLFSEGNVGVWELGFLIPIFTILYWAFFRRHDKKKNIILDDDKTDPQILIDNEN